MSNNKKNTVEVLYNENTLETLITVNGKSFDTSRINGKEIADWAYPFMMRKVRWNGFYDEMVQDLGGQKAFDLVFEGSEEALAELREAWENAPVNIISGGSLGSVVTITYDENRLTTEITVNGQPFDTSRINGKEIADWVYPFMMRKVKWEGIFEELAKEVGSQDYTIQFSGSNSAMNELMEECPVNVNIKVVRRTVALNSTKKQIGTGNELCENNEDENVFKCCLEAAEEGNAEAQCMVGDCYFKGIGTKEDENKAFKWYLKAAEQGYVEAQYSVGRCYNFGFGTEDDDYKAFNWYLKAAEQGHNSAQYYVGLMYFCGYGVEEDNDEALKWFLKSAEQDDDGANAIYMVGKCYLNSGIEEDENKAFKYFLKAAEQDNIDALCSIGLCYERGIGVEQDYDEAFEWYMKAAEKGNAIAQTDVGRFYYNGLAPDVDYDEAFRYFMMASEESEEAQFYLGECYYVGFGVEADDEEAEMWYQRSADDGFAPALYHVAENNEDEFEAFEQYMKAAEQGYSLSILAVADCYYTGKGVDEDIYEAVEWYEKAAEYGEARAICQLGVFYLDGIVYAKDEYKAVEYFEEAYYNNKNRYSTAGIWLGLAYYFGWGNLAVNYNEAFQLFEEYHEKYGEEQATYWLAECYRLGHGTYKDRNKAFELFQELTNSSDSDLSESAQKMCVSIRQNADRDDQIKKTVLNGAKRVGAEALRMSGLPFSSIIASIIDEL